VLSDDDKSNLSRSIKRAGNDLKEPLYAAAQLAWEAQHAKRKS